MLKNICHYICVVISKGFSTQQALLSLLERWKNVLDKERYGEAILMDFSKAFDMLKHDFLLGKLHAYGFSEESI